MYKLSPLSILLLLLTFHIKAFGYDVIPYTQRDTIPQVAVPKVAPAKAGLLKKFAQALQFSKNARAREQARILDIITRSGLKDSLEATVRRLNAIDSGRRTAADSTERGDIRLVLNAIDALKAKLAKQQAEADSIEVAEADSNGVSPVDEQAIQNMAKSIISPLTPAEQQHLTLIRQLLQGPQPVTEKVTVNDSLTRQYTYRVGTSMAIAGLYPFNAKEQDIRPDLRLISEVDWYSAGFDAATGHMTGARDWQTSAGLDSARAKGCGLGLCVQVHREKDIATLLDSPRIQQVLIHDIITALDTRNATGVNILFDNPPAASSAAVSGFVIALSQALQRTGHRYRLGLRIPAFAADDIYDLPTLNVYVDRFLVDFTEYQPGTPGPLAPLAGQANNSLKTSLSRLTIPIPAAKLMACLPYFGIGWTRQSGHWTDPQPISYHDLRIAIQHQQLAPYDPVTATERLDIHNKAGVVTRQIWYDDDVSLAAKYDFIAEYRLGGVVIQSLGDDDDYGELWDVMAAKLAVVDTTMVALRSSRKKGEVLDDWQWSWTYIDAKIEQYTFLFSYPCETSFPRVLVRKWEQAGVKNNDRNVIHKEETTVFGVLSIVLALLVVGGVVLFINRMRRVGEQWKWTKPLAGLLIFLFILLTIVAFMYIFLDTKIAAFGVSDNAADCFDFPVGTLFMLIFSGVAIGVGITRSLVSRLIKKDDIP